MWKRHLRFLARCCPSRVHLDNLFLIQQPSTLWSRHSSCCITSALLSFFPWRKHHGFKAVDWQMKIHAEGSVHMVTIPIYFQVFSLSQGSSRIVVSSTVWLENVGSWEENQMQQKYLKKICGCFPDKSTYEKNGELLSSSPIRHSEFHPNSQF